MNDCDRNRLQNHLETIAFAAAASALEGLQQPSEIEPPPPYDEALNSATHSGAQDGVPTSQSTPSPPRDLVPPPRSPLREIGCSPRIRCPQVAHSTEPTLREGSRTTRQGDIRRQNVERTIGDASREPEDPWPLVQPITTMEDYWRGSVGLLTVRRSGDDYYSDTALFQRRVMEEQQERIDTMESRIETQRRTILSLQRELEYRDRVIQEKNDRLQDTSSRLRQTEALLQIERKRNRKWFSIRGGDENHGWI